MQFQNCPKFDTCPKFGAFALDIFETKETVKADKTELIESYLYNDP